MPTILTKRSNTPGAIPATANLTNAAGGAELAVNTADKRLFTITSGSQVVELGTNPASLTCADGSFTLLKAASASITNLTATSLVLSNLSIASANVTVLTSASATITNLLATTLTVSGVGIFPAGTVSAPAITTTGDTNTGIYFPAADTIAFAEGGVEAMRIDSSGNLGLGVTPSAWGGGYTGLQVRNALSLWASSGTAAYYSNNVYYDGSSRKYVFSGTAAEYEQSGSGHAWKIAASGTAGNAITFTQAMTLDASGNLGVGTTSPGAKLDVSAAGGATIRISNSTTSSGSGDLIGALDYYSADADSASVRSYIRAYFSDAFARDSYLTFATNVTGGSATERMRITGGGDLLVGTTSGGGANTGITLYGSGSARFISDSQNTANTVSNAFTNSNSNNTDLIEFNVGQFQKTCIYVRNSGAGAGNTVSHIVFQYGTTPTTAGSITSVGTTVTYGSASDVRLKTDLGVCKTSRIPNIVIHDFEWKSTGVKAKGAFAQELHQVAPEAVVVGKDDVNEHGELKMPWQIDYSKLIPDLIVEIQSLRKRVAELETK